MRQFAMVYPGPEIVKQPASQLPWEHIVTLMQKISAKGYTLADLDEDLIAGVIRKAVEVKRLPETALKQDLAQVLERLELSEKGQLTDAAVALFGKRLNADFLQCELKLARFNDTDRHEFLDSDLRRDNLFELLEAGLLFIRRHLPLAARIESNKIKRVETPLIPFEALREALLNALCHRSYEPSSGAIGLAIYDDRLEIFNHGGLPVGLSIEMIKAGYSKPLEKNIQGESTHCIVIKRSIFG